MSKDRTSKEQRTVLMWVDLETTGLDEKNGRILEYAIMFTDLELKFAYPSLTSIIKQDVAEARALMDDYCINMHSDNGLLDEIAAAGPGVGVGYENQIKIYEIAIVTVLKAMLSKNENTIFVIAGSTIGFDRRWLKEHMPLLEKQLHYRQLDVSGYKVGFPELFGTATSDAHRAMPDIRDSIAAQQKMRDLIEDAWKYEQLA